MTHRNSSGVVWAAMAACAGGMITGCGKAGPDYSAAQRDSLATVFYLGAPLPPEPEPEEIAAAGKRIAAAKEWEKLLLTELYPENPALWAYAVRDSDDDGVPDFRVSDFYGKFMEGDIDVDGDGLDNYLDPEPYLANDTPETSTSGLPDALNWALQNKPAGMATIQRDLFDNHRILLVERTARFTPELVEAIHDIVERVFHQVFADGGTLRTLRIIATEDHSLLDPDDEEGSSDYAQVLAATQTMTIYNKGIGAAPVIQLGFLAHELAHNIQFDYDYDRERQNEIVYRNYVAADNFHHLLRQFDWTTRALTADPETEYSLFRPQYTAPDPVEYLYQEETVDEWLNWLEAIYDEVGEEQYLQDPRLVEANVLGDYSMSGPWEWYSDFVIAYVYLAMLDSVRERCGEKNWANLAATFQSETVEAEWSYFRFENARGAPLMEHLGETIPMRPEDVSYLAETYLLATHPGICAKP